MILATFFLGAACGIALMNLAELCVTVYLKQSFNFAMLGDVLFNIVIIFVCIRLVLEGIGL